MQKKLILDYQKLIQTIDGMEGIKRTVNNYGIKTNLQKMLNYLNRVKFVWEEQNYKKQSKKIDDIRTLDDFFKL